MTALVRIVRDSAGQFGEDRCTTLAAAIFKFMPDAVISWRDVWVGAIVTACLFTAGRFLLHFYFARAEPGPQLGAAAASLAVILVWIYYSSLILLVGAEFTRAFANASGEGVRPEPGAVRVVRVVEHAPPSS